MAALDLDQLRKAEEDITTDISTEATIEKIQGFLNSNAQIANFYNNLGDQAISNQDYNSASENYALAGQTISRGTVYLQELRQLPQFSAQEAQGFFRHEASSMDTKIQYYAGNEAFFLAA